MAAKRALELLKRFGLSFRRNWGLKLVSLFFAVILWNYIITEVNPSRPVVFRDVRVTFEGTEALNKANLSVTGQLPELFIDVYVKLPRNEFNLLSKDDIQATVNLSQITGDGVVDAKIVVRTPPRGIIDRFSKETVRIRIEKLEKKRVPVVYDPIGSVPQGYWEGRPRSDSVEITVEGASSLVSQVAKAQYSIDLENRTESFSSSLELVLLNAQNEVISMEGLNPSAASCIVDLDIYPTKTIRIDASKSIVGNVAKGYAIDAIEVLPVDITVAGQRSVLDAIDVLTPDPIDIDGVKNTISVNRELNLSSMGLHAVGSDSVRVLVRISEKMTTVELENLLVEVEGLAPGLNVDTKKLIVEAVTVKCPELMAQKIKKSVIRLYVDATGLDARTHTLNIHWEPVSDDLGITAVEADPILVTITAETP